MSVNIGNEYFLTKYEDIIISSATNIPSKPEGFDISPDSVIITRIILLLDLRDFRESFQKTINVTWNNNDGSYYYLVIENIEDSPQSIDPTDILGDLGINFEFTTSPTQENIFELRPLTPISMGLIRLQFIMLMKNTPYYMKLLLKIQEI